MTPPLLEVRKLRVVFGRRGVLRRRDETTAVDEVSFQLNQGETLALVGESGSGKSTTGYAVVGLVQPTSGTVQLDGVDLAALGREARRSLASRIQIIHQDPLAALDPRFTVGASILEPLRLQSYCARAEMPARLRELMDAVGLSPSLADRYPNQISGGQRQRVVIARAIALNPRLVVCDEAVSALDASIRSQILNLLMDLQERLGLSYLFISHDLSVVRHMSDRVAVMRAGRIIEEGQVDRVFGSPEKDYTRTLLAAIPIPDPATRKERRGYRRAEPV